VKFFLFFLFGRKTTTSTKFFVFYLGVRQLRQPSFIFFIWFETTSSQCCKAIGKMWWTHESVQNHGQHIEREQLKRTIQTQNRGFGGTAIHFTDVSVFLNL
jgi:hypothetical protein